MEIEEDTLGANPASVKSDDSSPRTNSGRGSPPPNCAICLGNCKNKSFTDSCLHQFCFSCLLTWSKVNRSTDKALIRGLQAMYGSASRPNAACGIMPNPACTC